MTEADFKGTHCYTKSIAAASALIAIGAKIRPINGVTFHKNGSASGELIFWFEAGQIEIAGVAHPVGTWLAKFLSPWVDFGLSLDHPWAFLKAAAENRQTLLPAVKMAQDHPFRVLQKNGRAIVVGSKVSDEQIRKLVNQG